MPITIAQYVVVDGTLDAAVLESACVTAAHEFGSGMLKLLEIDGEPFQQIDSELSQSVEVVDLSGEREPEAAALEWMRQEYTRPFDLLTDRLVKSAVLSVGANRQFWYCRIHHLVLDGYGAMNFMTRIAELYSAEVAGLSVPESSATDLLAVRDAEAEYRHSPRFRRDQDYWQPRQQTFRPWQVWPGSGWTPQRVRSWSAEHSTVRTRRRRRTSSLRRRRWLLSRSTSPGGPARRRSAEFAGDRAHEQGSARFGWHDLQRRSAAPRGDRYDHGCRIERGCLARTDRRAQTSAVPHRGHEARSRPRCRAGVLRSCDQHHELSPEVVLGSVTGRFHVLSTGPVEDLSVNIYPSASGEAPRIDFEAIPICTPQMS